MITPPPPRDTLDGFIDLLVDDIVAAVLAEDAEAQAAQNEERERMYYEDTERFKDAPDSA